MIKLYTLLILIPSFIYPFTPNEQALEIAKKSRKVLALQNELVSMVKKIKPDGKTITKEILKDTIELLTSTKLTFKVEAKFKDEVPLLEKLVKTLGDDNAFSFPEDNIREARPSLFPDRKPMPFLAAPGGPWLSHHVYPGGLIYHTYTVAKSNQDRAILYNRTYQSHVSVDLALLSGIWHDAMKTWTITWKEDGSTTINEGKIAGTSLHHIMVLAEMLLRKYPAPLILSVAGAHETLSETNVAGLNKIVDFIKAACLIADLPYDTAFLIEENGKWRFKESHKIEPLINFLGDGDWALSIPSMQISREAVLKYLSEVDPALSNKERNFKVMSLFSENGDLALYQAFIEGGVLRLKTSLEKPKSIKKKKK